MNAWLRVYQDYKQGEERLAIAFIDFWQEFPQFRAAQRWASLGAATDDTAAVFLIGFDATIMIGLGFGKSDRRQEGFSLRELAFVFAMFGQHGLAAELLAHVLDIANENGISEVLEPKVTLHISCDGRVGIGLDMSALQHDPQRKRPRMAASIGRMNMFP